MADSGMTLADGAGRFFGVIESSPAVGGSIAYWPVELMLTAPSERVTIEFKDGVPGDSKQVPADQESGYWTLELCADREVFDAIFAGALTMGEAMFAALLYLPEEKGKHNLSCALGQTIRLAQEAHRRTADPRRLAVAGGE